MIASFKNYMFTQTALSAEEIERIAALAVQRKVARNEFILKEGEICKHKIFIVNGLLRTFGTTPDGLEHILHFSQENSWTVDVESYNEQIPSLFNINAIETSELLLWCKADFDKLIAKMPGFNVFREQLISRNTYQSRKRILTTLSATPKEKYNDFIMQYPGLLARLPLRMIAAYLGISLKTLTRIRHAQLQR